MSPYLLGFGCQLMCNTAPNNVWDYGYKPHLLKAINSTKDSNGIARNALLPLSVGIDEKYDVIGGVYSDYRLSIEPGQSFYL